MNWNKIIGCTIFVAILVAFGCFYVNNNNKLTCFRENGDKIDVTFNTDGINKIYINDKEMEEMESILYQTKFLSSFTFIQIGYDTEELIPKYMEKVREYEENNQAICR